MRDFITGSDIEIARSTGKKEIRIRPEDVVTGIARETAEKLGIAIVIGAPEPGRPPSVPTDPRGETPGRISPPYDIDAWRKKFPILRDHFHVANCSQAPQSDYTRQASLEFLENWDTMGMDWDRWMEEVHLAKAEFARLINADPSEIALGSSVSEITNAVASALSFSAPRNKVVVTEAEFPTIGHVWLGQQKYGARVSFLPVKNGVIEIADYDRYVDEQTLIASICDVYYYNGFKQNLAQIVPIIHSKGALVYLDAYQGIGTHPIDVKALDIDFLATGNLKYLLGISGVAFLYVKKELISHLKPVFTGWFGRREPFAFQVKNLDYAEDARRFDNGTPPVIAAYIARAGMRMINEVGPSNIQAWTDHLSRHCIDGAGSRGLEVASPLDIRQKAPNTAIRVAGNAHDVELALRKKKVIASARNDVIRIATHFFTRTEDIDYILDRLVEILKRS